MKVVKLYIYMLVSALMINGCITPFEPEGYAQLENLLVIEGDITANEQTEIIVSRSLKLNDISKRNYIKGAVVWVESELGLKFPANQVISGTDVKYVANTAGLDASKKYKLCVRTPDGKSYESDLVPVIISPDIDNIEFVTDTLNKSVTFYVNTHDDSNKTHYYKWSYTEDWEFTSHIYSSFEYNPLTMKISEIPSFQKNRFYCWNKDVSKKILTTSTTHLSSDRVYRMPLVSMGSLDLRISVLYCIDVKQRALSREGYQYWETLRKNSDQVGGIFSPQPSEMKGNIKCITDPEETVLGFISAGYVSKKRFFASKEEIGVYYNPHICETVIPESFTPPVAWSTMFDTGYDVVSNSPSTRESVWAPVACVDCRIFGTKNKPSFWPNDHI